MAAICSQVSSVTEFHHTKPPKLDQAAETEDSSKSAKRWETGAGFDDDSSDGDFGAPRLCPQLLCPQEVEELSELSEFALSLCETQHVSSVTESDHTKPKLKLDDGDTDEAAETIDSLKYAKRGETGAGLHDDSTADSGFKVEAAETKDTSKSPERGETTTGFDDETSEDDFDCKLIRCPLENGEAEDLSDFALSLYEKQHPGEGWKFKSVHEAYRTEHWCSCATSYHLEFVGKKADGKSIRNFVVDADCSAFDPYEKLTLYQCVLLKDDEVGRMDENIKEKVSMETSLITYELKCNELQKDEIVEFCKSALTYYEELHSGEAYEFVEIQMARRCIVGGIFIFHAKKKADATLATFKAYSDDRALDMDIKVVGSLSRL
ncbi:PREDICTED: uncharacterized protein LOC109176274 isoform X2 [Ipomoea nil]|uniref:uncharacterized protein LOC109176274 isoform X2 n=1 Tax=Ipomoea nil TaxID=35883 RepID=UPI000901CBCC|nr:PREDICTED: uncharacterized protein LOC109176274 isoform X2 [Ipomoea nil]